MPSRHGNQFNNLRSGKNLASVPQYMKGLSKTNIALAADLSGNGEEKSLLFEEEVENKMTEIKDPGKVEYIPQGHPTILADPQEGDGLYTAHASTCSIILYKGKKGEIGIFHASPYDKHYNTTYGCNTDNWIGRNDGEYFMIGFDDEELQESFARVGKEYQKLDFERDDKGRFCAGIMINNGIPKLIEGFDVKVVAQMKNGNFNPVVQGNEQSNGILE